MTILYKMTMALFYIIDLQKYLLQVIIVSCILIK